MKLTEYQLKYGNSPICTSCRGPCQTCWTTSPNGAALCYHCTPKAYKDQLQRLTE